MRLPPGDSPETLEAMGRQPQVPLLLQIQVLGPLVH